MKHISKVIQDMVKSGKYGTVVIVAEEEPKLTNLQVQALLFAVFANGSKADLKGLGICHMIGEVISNMYHDEELTLHDAAIIVNTILEQISDEEAAQVITDWFLKAYEELDLNAAVNFYKMTKYLLKKEAH